jgi:coproporphyrinogen III oxidase-like Fe-S oxidoreductase
MLSERIISAVMRRGNDKYLRFSNMEKPELPPAIPGREYLLYVHVPFCERLCPYCSFNRFPYEQGVADAYFERLRAEMQMVADLGYDFSSMYVGGGTPTIDIDQLVKTLDLAKDLFSIKEVSSETNPNHLYPAWIDPIVDRVDRFSVGVQSLDDELLRQMDRYDKYGSAYQILERLASIDGVFHSLNVDMIFNFPSQTPDKLALDVELLKKAGCNQVTFYPLMASPAVAESLKNSVGRVDYAREYEYYKFITRNLAETFEPASAWTFSRVGGGMIDEYIVDYEDYVGIGSGAFSFLDGTLYTNTFSLRSYNAAIDEGHSSVIAERSFDKGDRMRYRFLMQLFSLRLDKRQFERDFGTEIERALAFEIAYFRAVGAFEVDNDHELVLSPKGRYLLVAMMREFFIGVNNLRDQARSALSGEERRLLFGDGCDDTGHPLAAAVVDTESAETLPVP